jgi:hypothetical protein
MRKITVEQLERAVNGAPAVIKKEAQDFLQRGLSEYKKVAVRSPWRIGESGGGIPVDTGNLRRDHYTRINGLEGRFGVDPNRVRYASFVHEGTRRMQARPWLDYAKIKADYVIRKHYNKFLDNILKTIAT